MTRLIALFPDGTYETYDFEPRPGEVPTLKSIRRVEDVHRANVIISINTTTGETEVQKNRWGQQGPVVPRQR